MWAWPDFKKMGFVLRRLALESTLPPHNDGAAAESRKGLNLVLTLRANCCGPACGRVLREYKMRPVLMVVEHVGRHQPFEMPVIQDDHVVQQVASATSHPARADVQMRHSRPSLVAEVLERRQAGIPDHPSSGSLKGEIQEFPGRQIRY